MPAHSIRASTSWRVSGYFGPRQRCGKSRSIATFCPARRIRRCRAGLARRTAASGDRSQPGAGRVRPAKAGQGPQRRCCPRQAETPTLDEVKARIDAGPGAGAGDCSKGSSGSWWPATTATGCQAPLGRWKHSCTRSTAKPNWPRRGSSASLKRPLPVAADRLKRQFDELTDFTQSCWPNRPTCATSFWAQADRTVALTRPSGNRPRGRYRKYFYDEVIGRFDRPLMTAKPRTRKVYDEPSSPATKWCSTCFPTSLPTESAGAQEHSSRASGGRWSSASMGWKAGRRTRSSTVPAEHFYNCLPPGWPSAASSPTRRKIRTSSKTASARCSQERTRCARRSFR